jgi:hypothetical protein
MAGVEFSFESSSASGAVLVMTQPTNRKDLMKSRDIVNYIRRHVDSWYEFVNIQLRMEVEEGSIFLVRGCDQTPAWAVAAFKEAGTALSFGFRGGYSPIAGGGLHLSGSWKDMGSVAHRSGPEATPNKKIALAETTGSVSDAFLLPRVENALDYNQTVFLRVWKIKRRPFVIPHSIKAASGPLQLDSGSKYNHNGAAGASLVSQSDIEIIDDDDSEDYSEHTRHVGTFRLIFD